MFISPVGVNEAHDSKGSLDLPMADPIASSFPTWFVKKPKLFQHTVTEMPCLWLKAVGPSGGPGNDLKVFSMGHWKPQLKLPSTERGRGRQAEDPGQCAWWHVPPGCACQVLEVAANRLVLPQTTWPEPGSPTDHLAGASEVISGRPGALFSRGPKSNVLVYASNNL